MRSMRVMGWASTLVCAVLSAHAAVAATGNTATARTPPAKAAAKSSGAVPGQDATIPKSSAPERYKVAVPPGVLLIEFNDLTPADWYPEREFDELMKQSNTKNLSDSDPKAKELQRKMEAMWSRAPVVTYYNGKRVKMPGYVVPLENNATTVSEFLLVPYFGACIHTPPPPSNQIVYVKTGKTPAKTKGMFDTVWVTGTLRAERSDTDVASAGYRIDDASVEPFD